MSDPFRSELDGALEKLRRVEEELADLRAEHDSLKANPPYRERHPVRVFLFVGVMMIAAGTFSWLYWRNSLAKEAAIAHEQEQAAFEEKVTVMKHDVDALKAQLDACHGYLTPPRPQPPPPPGRP